MYFVGFLQRMYFIIYSYNSAYGVNEKAYNRCAVCVSLMITVHDARDHPSPGAPPENGSSHEFRSRRGKKNTKDRFLSTLHDDDDNNNNNIILQQQQQHQGNIRYQEAKLTVCNNSSYKDELPSEMRAIQKLEFCLPALCDSQRNVRALA